MSIKSELANLKDTDVYSLMLFALYKFTGVPEYSAISELAYVLDKDNLLSLCEYFGGTTIQIPTTSELENLVYSLLLYQYVNIDNVPYAEACEIIGHRSSELRQVKKNYIRLCDMLKDYTFKPRDSVKR